jgi:hypothetical protein
MFDPVTESELLAQIFPLLFYVFPELFSDPAQVVLFLVELINAVNEAPK